MWIDFLANKFSTTELELARVELEDLPENTYDPYDDLLEKEFNDALRGMKTGKAPGPDQIPAVVWQNSQLAREDLFFY